MICAWNDHYPFPCLHIFRMSWWRSQEIIRNHDTNLHVSPTKLPHNTSHGWCFNGLSAPRGFMAMQLVSLTNALCSLDGPTTLSCAACGLCQWIGFQGKCYRKAPVLSWVRCRFSQQNQSIDAGAALIMLVLYGDRFKQKKRPSALVHWAEAGKCCKTSAIPVSHLRNRNMGDLLLFFLTALVLK